MSYNYKNWKDYYWNTIYLLVKSYPIHNANNSSKKKFYIIFSNMIDFLPNPIIKKQIKELIGKYSMVPYLDNKVDLARWVNFIHNKVSLLNGINTMNLSERQAFNNKLFNPPCIIKKKIHKISINKQNIINLIILFLTIYIVLSFI